MLGNNEQYSMVGVKYTGWRAREVVDMEDT